MRPSLSLAVSLSLASPVVEANVPPADFDAEARPPKNALQRGTRRLDRFFRWWASPDAIFALKYVVGSIAIWLFQCFRTTAYLSYSQKGASRLSALDLFETAAGR